MAFLRAVITAILPTTSFEDLAWKSGFAATHQRIPSISLATVYNNLRLFR